MNAHQLREALKARGGPMPRARHQPRTAGEMNKLEVSYNAHLKLREQVGDVLWYAYEGVKLKLAKATFLTPDFVVVNAAGEVEFHECKGFMEEDAAVKIKVAAELFPFRFFVVRARKKSDGGGFTIDEV